MLQSNVTGLLPKMSSHHIPNYTSSCIILYKKYIENYNKHADINSYKAITHSMRICGTEINRTLLNLLIELLDNGKIAPAMFRFYWISTRHPYNVIIYGVKSGSKLLEKSVNMFQYKTPHIVKYVHMSFEATINPVAHLL